MFDVEGHDRQVRVLVEEADQFDFLLLLEVCGPLLHQLIPGEPVCIIGRIGDLGPGQVVLVQRLDLDAIYEEFDGDLQRFVILEATRLDVDYVKAVHLWLLGLLLVLRLR